MKFMCEVNIETKLTREPTGNVSALNLAAITTDADVVVVATLVSNGAVSFVTETAAFFDLALPEPVPAPIRLATHSAAGDATLTRAPCSTMFQFQVDD